MKKINKRFYFMLYLPKSKQYKTMEKENSIRIVVGEKLKEFRESRGLTLEEVAQKAGISQYQVLVIETGKKNYSIDDFFSYVHGNDLYLYFGEKENKQDAHDFEEIAKKATENHPEK